MISRADMMRAAIIAMIQSLIPVLIILDLVDWDDNQVATIMLFVTNAVTLAFLFYPSNHSAV